MAKVATPEVIGRVTFKGHAWGVRAETARRVDISPGDQYDVLALDVGRDGRPIFTLADPHVTYIPDATTYDADGKVMHPGADAEAPCTIRVQIADDAVTYKDAKEPGKPHVQDVMPAAEPASATETIKEPKPRRGAPK